MEDVECILQTVVNATIRL